MRNFFRASISGLFICFLVVSGLLGFSTSTLAAHLETQPYFVKQIVRDKVLSVSPNFRGDLTQASLLPSLAEISQSYHIKAAKAISAEKLNGKTVPGLIVYVESKSTSPELAATLASKP